MQRIRIYSGINLRADGGAKDFALGFIPGYDLYTAIKNPQAGLLDYTIGVLGILGPLGKESGLAAKGLEAALEAGGKGIQEGTRAIGSAKEFFEGASYSREVLGKMSRNDFHSFSDLVTNYAELGTVTRVAGGDGVVRQLLEITGGYGSKNGVFQFLKEDSGVITHRFFKAEKR